MKTSKDIFQSRQTQSIENLKILLELIITSPQKYKDSHQIINSLKSQGATASLEFDFEANGKRLSLTPMSLNSLKRYANEHYTEGFRGIDKLRVKAHDSLISAKDKAVRSNKRTKSGMLLRIEELENTLQRTQQANFILLQAISQSMQSITSINEASSGMIRNKRAQEALQAIRAIVSICPEPFNTTPENLNIIPIHNHLT
jgi:hypothetical protein